MQERFHSFNSYLQNIFGERVQRISLDAGFDCPNIDGTLSTRGCIYCNNKGFSRFVRSSLSLEDQISSSVEFYKKRFRVNKFIAYFQSFTNTYADRERLKKQYDVVRKFSQIVGLFISTRPDCVNEEKMQLIASYKKDYLVWVEYGLQSTQERILRLINRNHTYEDFLSAYKLTRDYGINVGVHLIAGLPTANYGDMIDDAARLAKLDIQGVKFHILHLLRNTELERIDKKNNLDFLTQNEYVKSICDFLERMPSSLVVLRLVSGAHPDYLIAPLWINDKHRVIEQIRKELENRGTEQGYYYENACS